MAAPSPTATDLQELALMRLAEAEHLLQAGLANGAWYLAGYAVECALKAVICRTLNLAEYPDRILRGALKTHVLDDLVQLAGLTAELEEKKKDSIFNEFWDVVVSWDPQNRYLIKPLEQASDFVLAVNHSPKGIFVWLSSQW